MTDIPTISAKPNYLRRVLLDSRHHHPQLKSYPLSKKKTAYYTNPRYLAHQKTTTNCRHQPLPAKSTQQVKWFQGNCYHPDVINCTPYSATLYIFSSDIK